MKFLVTIALLTAACMGQVVQDEGSFGWFQSDEEAFWVNISAHAGDLVAIRLTCSTGTELKDCGAPEFDYTGNWKYQYDGSEFDCPETWTINDITENACLFVAEKDGTFRVYIPVLQSGIEYYGDYQVTEGP